VLLKEKAIAPALLVAIWGQQRKNMLRMQPNIGKWNKERKRYMQGYGNTVCVAEVSASGLSE
jgi:hypothetical protein